MPLRRLQRRAVTAGGPAPLRHLGRARLVHVGLNSIVGGGIFILPATVAALTGAASLAAYVVAAAVVLGVGSALARLAARHESSGGPYLYVERAFGPAAGFQVGWLFCLTRLTAFANLLNGVALYVGALLPDLARPAPRALLIASCAAAVTGINVAGIRQTSWATDLFAILKILPLVLVGLLGLALADPARLVPGPVAAAPFVRAVLLLVYAFTGFEILTVPAEEARRPRSDVPFALFASILSVSAVYLLVHAAALGALPALGAETAPLASLAGRLWGGAGRAGMTAVAAVSMAGCSLASLLGASRMLYAMASDGRIPAAIGALDPVRRTPARAALLTATVGAALAIAGGYAFLAAVSSGSRLLIYLACCLAGLRAPHAIGPEAGGGAPRPGGRWIAVATAASIGVLLCGLERREVLFGMIGVGAGIGLERIARRARRDVTMREAL